MLPEKDSSAECSDLNMVFALSYVMDLLDIEEFHNFLAKRKTKCSDDIFDGFIFLAKTVSRSFLEEISRGWSLNLPETITFSRALHSGVPLEKIKNSSQKVVFIKNLHQMLRTLWKSNDATSYSRNHKFVQDTFLKTIKVILESNVDLRKDVRIHGKHKVVRRMAILYALIYLGEIRHGYPQGFFFSLSKTPRPNEYTSKVFRGYKFGLAFVWKRLLDEEKVTNKKLLITKLLKSRNWKTLDAQFEFINNYVVAPLEEEINISFGFGKYFEIKKPISTELWDKSLFQKPSDPTLSKEEDLQQELLWYPIQAMTGHYVFNGVTTFSSLLIGTVNLKRRHGNDEKTFVVRFVHPVGEGKNDYSYAVLIEAYGTIGDYSGWLVFYDCCGDYSGFAGGEHRFAEETIDRYSKEKAIEVINYNINSQDLLNYLKVFSADITDEYEPIGLKIPVEGDIKKHKKMLESLSLSSIITRQNSTIETCKGFLLELLGYYFFSSDKYRVRWRYTNEKIIGEGDIDIIAQNPKGLLLVVSCMSSFDIEKIRKLVLTSEKLKVNRVKLTKELGEFQNIRNVILVADDLTPSQQKESKKFDVDVYSLRELFRSSPHFTTIKKIDLERIFLKTEEEARLNKNMLFDLLS
jgi:hypothetical protein